jgi:hypothetical protein
MADTATLEKFTTTVGSTFIWHELSVPSAQKAIDFYTEAFGFTVKTMDIPGDNSGMKYHILERDGVGVAGVMGTEGAPGMDGVPPNWATFLSVDDVDARLAKCQELGATVVVPPMDIPTVGRMTLIADNQGAHFWLFKPTNE